MATDRYRIVGNELIIEHKTNSSKPKWTIEGSIRIVIDPTNVPQEPWLEYAVRAIVIAVQGQARGKERELAARILNDPRPLEAVTRQPNVKLPAEIRARIALRELGFPEDEIDRLVKRQKVIDHLESQGAI